MRGAIRLALTLAAACAVWGQAPPPVRMAARPMPDLPKMLAYRLTGEGLGRYTQASRNVTALIARDPHYRERMKVDPQTAPHSVDESVAYARKNFPEYYAAVEKAGISFRDYTLFEGSLLLAWVATERPRPNSKVVVMPENLKFVKENREKIAALLAEKKR